MPLSVGDVYIDIHGDAKPFERDLRRALAQVDRRFRLDKALGNLLDERRMSKELDLLAQRWGRQLAAQSQRGLGNVTPDVDLSVLRREVRDLAQELGEDVQKVEQGFVKRLNRAIDDANKEYVTGLESRAKYWLKVSQDATKVRERQEREARRAAEQAARLAERQRKESERAADAIERLRLTTLIRDLKITEDFTRRLRFSLRRIRTATESNAGLIAAQAQEKKILEDLAVAQANGEKNVVLQLERQRVLVSQIVDSYTKRTREVRRANRDLFSFDRGAFRGIDRTLLRLRNGLRRAGTGGFFDAFTNFLAIGPTVIRTFTRLGTRITTFPLNVLSRIGDGIQLLGLRLGSKGLANAGARLASLASALGPVASIVGAIVGATAGLALLIKVLGVVASAISVTVGALTIMASALLYAAGSVAAFVPLLAALPLALGTAALAFKGVGPAISAYNEVLNASNPEELAEAQEKYNEALGKLQPNARKAVQALEPVVRQFKELQKTVQDKVFEGLDEEIRNLEQTFDVVEQGIADTADSINRVFRDIAQTFSTDQFKQDLEGVFSGLGPIIEDLGSALGDFVAGLTGLIDALLPSGKELSGTIANIAESFKEFTQSETGKNKIADFMDKAREAAEKVFGILGNITSALGTLLGGAQDEGQTFLDKVLEKTQEFEDWVNRIVEDGTLDRWLADAETAMGAFADVLGSAADAFDALDTPANRQLFSDLLSGFSGFLDWATDVIDFFNGPDWNGLTDIIVEPIVAVLNILAQIPSIVPGFGIIGDAARNALTAIDNVRTASQAPAETGTAAWSDTLLANLTGIQAEGGLTKAQLEEIFLVANTESVFAPGMLEDLALLTLQGQLTKGEFEQVVGEKVPPNWPTDFIGLLGQLVAQGDITVAEVDEILSDKSVPSWAKMDFVASLSDIIGKGELTDEQMRELLGAKNLPGWLRTELSAALDRGRGKAQEADAAIDAIPGQKDVSINVSDNGTIASFNQAMYNAVQPAYKQVFVDYSYRELSGRPGARGGLFTQPTNMLIGEAGTEALVPLNRPLSQIDKSVRPLAALIRGAGSPGVPTNVPVGGASTVVGGGKPSKTVNVTMNVFTKTADPEAVAASVASRAVSLARL